MLIIDSINDDKVVGLLLRDKVGILPTDTIYGIVCRAASKTAANKLYTLKPREFKPGTIIAADTEQIIKLGVKSRYVSVIENLWPNPISIILPIGAELNYLDQGRANLPFRIPKDKNLLALLEKTGPLLTTSANDPDCPAANTIAEAVEYFHDRADFYVDGGDMSKHKPSTIIRIIDDELIVLREGAVSAAEINRLLAL